MPRGVHVQGCSDIGHRETVCSLEARSQGQVIKALLLNVFGRGWISVEGKEEEQEQGIEREGGNFPLWQVFLEDPPAVLSYLGLRGSGS